MSKKRRLKRILGLLAKDYEVVPHPGYFMIAGNPFTALQLLAAYPPGGLDKYTLGEIRFELPKRLGMTHTPNEILSLLRSGELDPRSFTHHSCPTIAEYAQSYLGIFLAEERRLKHFRAEQKRKDREARDLKQAAENIKRLERNRKRREKRLEDRLKNPPKPDPDVLARQEALRDLKAPKDSGGAKGWVYASKAAGLLGITLGSLRKILSPAKEVVNPHYISGPNASLYDPRDLLAIRDSNEVVKARSRRRKSVDAP